MQYKFLARGSLPRGWNGVGSRTLRFVLDYNWNLITKFSLIRKSSRTQRPKDKVTALCTHIGFYLQCGRIIFTWKKRIVRSSQNSLANIIQRARYLRDNTWDSHLGRPKLNPRCRSAYGFFKVSP